MSHFRTLETSNSLYETNGLKFLTVKSKNLKGRGNICLFVPPNAEQYNSLPIYILLHGVYGSAWSWALKGGAHITANKMIFENEIKPAILAMPSDGLWGDGSAYLTHKSKDFAQWIVSDVPQAVREALNCTDHNSPLCIAGLSMGGYGAFQLGIKNSEKISAVSAHSAITRFQELANFVEEPLNEYNLADDHIDVISACSSFDNLPPIRFDCGTEDPLIEANRTLHHQLKQKNIPHIYEEFSGGHEWPYWHEHLKKTLLFFDTTLNPKN